MEGSLLLLLVVCMAGLRAQDKRTVSRGPGETLSVQCQYPEKYTNNIKTWCRATGRNRCDLIVVTPSTIPPRTSSSGGTSIVDNKGTRVISVMVNNLTEQDSGVYWCAVYLSSTDRLDIMMIIDLQVSKGLQAQDRQAVSRGPGETLSVQCQYPAIYRNDIKTWCRSTGRNRCNLIVVTPATIPPPSSSSGRTSIVDNKGTRVISVTVNNLTEQDAGVYWCAVYLSSTDTVTIMAIIDLQVSEDVRSTSMKTSTTHNIPSPTVSTDATMEVSQGYTVMDGTTNLSLSLLNIILISVGLGFLLLLTFIAALFYGTRIRRMQRTKDGGDTGTGTSRNVMRAEEAMGDDPSELDSQVVKYASLKLHANHSQSDATYGNIEFGRREASNIASSTETVEYASLRL